MRTETEKLIDETFLEAKKRCEEFKAESYEHALKFVDELCNFIREKGVISESNLFKLIDESINLRFVISSFGEDIEAINCHINSAPYHCHFKDCFNWNK